MSFLFKAYFIVAFLLGSATASLGVLYYSVVDGSALDRHPELSSNVFFEAVKASAHRKRETDAMSVDMTPEVAPLFESRAEDVIWSALREMNVALKDKDYVQHDVDGIQKLIETGEEVTLHLSRRALSYLMGKESPFTSGDEFFVTFEKDLEAGRLAVIDARLHNRTVYP